MAHFRKSLKCKIKDKHIHYERESNSLNTLIKVVINLTIKFINKL